MVAEFWGVYMVYFVETCGATSTVVAEVWGAYLTYIVDTFGATSIVVALVMVYLTACQSMSVSHCLSLFSDWT